MSEDLDPRQGLNHVSVNAESFDPTQDIQWLLNSEEAAEWLGRSVEYVEELAEEGRIPARRLRGEWRYGYASLNLWAEGKSLGSLAKQAVREAMQDELATEAIQRVSVDGEQYGFEIEPLVTMAAMEKAYILHVLNREDGHRQRAAWTLGIDPSTLYRKLKRYGIK